MKKVLILGSGALRIGQAGEFDYSGSQAIKALKEEGITVILINPNIATIQTSEYMADRVYFLPVDIYFVTKVIEKERPDGILLSFGGQTALNCGLDLEREEILEKYNVQVLGTPVEAIRNTEDRDLFVKKLSEIDLKVPKSLAAWSLDEAIEAAEKIDYPVIIRAAYTLGGEGSGVAWRKEDLIELAQRAFMATSQILVEEYLKDWREIEYEVVRDRYDNCITVCNMENFDPMGIHTGESIVVAPSQTLTNTEYHKLREIAIRAIRHLDIVGECNIQFALDYRSDDYRIIEVNARLSRSSALASKATGYPLALIAAKVALGYGLPELKNSITKSTTACFEPALDYIVVKIPRWDLSKFKGVSEKIGTEMKSVGEIMAIGRKFEEVIQKGLRMLDIGALGLVGNNFTFKDIRDELERPTDKRIFAIVEALKQGYTIEEISKLSGIDAWFLHKIQNLLVVEDKIKKYGTLDNLPREIFLDAKQKGFSDLQIAKLLNTQELEVRKRRKALGIIPFVKQIDTLAAEYPAKTNYLYLTYNGAGDDISFEGRNKVIVLGSGTYRIGSSVEFDWCCVNTVFTLNKLRYTTIMINYNPETVSTDYDICDKLYFEELSFEVVLDIYEKENPIGLIVSMGGQTPNNLALKCYRQGLNILGTSPLSIDRAEDRYKFSKLLDELGVDQPEWQELTSLEDAENFAHVVGYPVLVRPSYVLSGAAMSVVHDQKDLESYLGMASKVSREHPVVISKFVVNAKEIEIDAVAQDGEILTWAITEHIENAGVHSGDATMVFPPQKIYLETVRRIKNIAQRIALALKITGPFNIQFLAKDNDIKVIECNLRASRSFPFISKVSKLNFISLATQAMMGKRIRERKLNLDFDYVGVKAPQFSFSRLKGVDPILRVEMASTGEVACLGIDLYDAFLKALISTGFKLPKKTILLGVNDEESLYRLRDSIKKLHSLGFTLFATETTSRFLDENKIPNTRLSIEPEPNKPNVLDYLLQRKLDLVINISTGHPHEGEQVEYLIRRRAVDFGIPLLTNLQLTRLLIEALSRKNLEDLEVKAWDEYP
jgi:carbamoyl-phosphate synthase large subunit